MLRLGHEVIDWLSASNAVHANVVLVCITGISVVITGVYVVLTWRMAKAMAQQTRAMIQPVISLTIKWEPEFNPKGHFIIKNIGTQPLLLLDIRMKCNREGSHLFHDFSLWEEHFLGPDQDLRPMFDFIPEIEKELGSLEAGEFRRAWQPDEFGYSLEVVTSDMSKQVVNTYRNIPTLGVVYHDNRIPFRVRWRYFKRPFSQNYYRLNNYLYRIFKKGKR
jgi:hypothetical protein